MNARQYLQKVEKLDVMIVNTTKEKALELSRLERMAEGSALQSNEERVQTSTKKDTMALAICSKVDIEKDYDKKIAKLKAERERIIADIKSLNTAEYDVVYKLYVLRMPLYEVADSCKKSYSWASKTHKRGLKSIQKLLEERRINNG